MLNFTRLDACIICTIYFQKTKLIPYEIFQHLLSNTHQMQFEIMQSAILNFKNMKQKKKKIYEWIVKYRVRFEIFWIIFFRLLHGDYSSCWCSCEVQSEIKRTLNILWAYHYILVDTVLIFLWALFCLCICYETCRYCDRWRY